MKVKIIKTGETMNVNDSYGLRLITQGHAVPVKSSPSPKKKPVKEDVGE